jgi:hypothetical protein
MDEPRLCIDCRADLVGPFRPRITLTRSPAAQEADQEPLTVGAQAWICPACGLLHWYAEDEALARLANLVEKGGGEEAATPASSYERRAQMLRMLRRVRRM